MILHVNIANDVVVDDGVLARTIVPRLLLRVVRPIFQTGQFVIEVEDVVGLLIAEGLVLVLSQDFHHVPLLNISDLSFTLWVSE